MKANSITVAIVDDHKIIADGLERLMNESDTVSVIAKAHSAADCMELLEHCQPQVLLLDISMPDGNGIELCPQIKRKYPSVKVLMLTSYGELATVNRALDAGADGYVLKNSEPEELLAGILAVASGDRFFCEEVNATLKKSENSLLELTRREWELLRLINDGLTLPELAEKMCLGVNTIRGYRQKLNIKLGAHNTVQLLQHAKDLGLI
ncbi:MAG: response regulator transcription factor [Prevotellaceae bacterium]|jgi:DNA-binding NarL/FixJ family response regulator|nr:response regulator transcription factor [Prevotellaceae bacterium]